MGYTNIWIGIVIFSLVMTTTAISYTDMKANLGQDFTNNSSSFDQTSALLTRINDSTAIIVSSVPQSEEDFQIGNFLIDRLPELMKVVFNSNVLVLNIIKGSAEFIPVSAYWIVGVESIILVIFMFLFVKFARGVFGV